MSHTDISPVLSLFSDSFQSNLSLTNSSFPNQFVIIDLNVLSLSYSQFFVALTALKRRNYSSGVAYLSEKQSPDNSVLNDCRIPYAIRELCSKKFLSRISPHKFIVRLSCPDKIKISYDLFSFLYSNLNEFSCIGIKSILSFIFSQNTSPSYLQNTLRIRKATSFLVSSSLSSFQDTLLSSLSDEIELTKSLYSIRKDVHITIDSTVSTSVPNYLNTVPDLPYKRIILNNNNNQSHSTLLNDSYSELKSISDRFFSDFYNVFNSDLSEPSYIDKTFQSSSLNYSTDHNLYLIVLSLAHLSKHQSFFMNIDVDYLFKSIAEVVLNFRNKLGNIHVINLRSYFFRSLINFISSNQNEFPLLDKHISNRRRKSVEVIDHNKAYYDSKIDDEMNEVIREFEIEYGISFNYESDYSNSKFISFCSEYRNKKLHNEPFNPHIELNDKLPQSRNTSTDSSNVSKLDHISDIFSHNLNIRMKPISVPSKTPVNSSSIILKLFKNGSITLDEKSILPEHIVERLVEEKRPGSPVTFRL